MKTVQHFSATDSISADKRLLSSRIALQTRIFQAKGGEIQHIPMGAIADPEGHRKIIIKKGDSK